jgi:long-chain acyl-CoA synthetase
MRLADTLDASTKKKPHKTAIIFQGTRYSYQQVLDRVQRLSGALMDLGIKQGDRVAILLKNSPQYIISYYAIARIGAVCVPINNFLKGEEIQYILQDCEVSCFITSKEYLEKIDTMVSSLNNLKHIILDENEETIKTFAHKTNSAIAFHDLHSLYQREPLISVGRDFSAEGLAVIIYTSGTTGFPKGAMLSHKNLISNAKSCLTAIKVVEKDRFLLFLPLFHSFTQLVCMVLPIYNTNTIILIPKIERKELRKSILKYRPTIFVGIPAIYNVLINQKLSWLARWLNPVRVYVSGAAPLSKNTILSFNTIFRRPLLEGYGLSEASPVVCVNPLDGVKKAGSVGLPIHNVAVKVVNKEHKEFPPNEVGELLVKGPNVMMGYYKKPEDNEKILRHGWLYTGDLARIDEDGYIYIVDRKKDMLLYRGLNIYPREIEDVLYSHPSVEQVAVVGIQHASRGEIPKAFVVLKQGFKITAADLKHHCIQKLADYKVPKLFEFVNQLPISSTGKVLKRELREQLAKGILPNKTILD